MSESKDKYRYYISSEESIFNVVVDVETRRRKAMCNTLEDAKEVCQALNEKHERDGREPNSDIRGPDK